jgi:hypothetical protein
LAEKEEKVWQAKEGAKKESKEKSKEDEGQRYQSLIVDDLQSGSEEEDPMQ